MDFQVHESERCKHFNKGKRRGNKNLKTNHASHIPTEFVMEALDLGKQLDISVIWDKLQQLKGYKKFENEVGKQKANLRFI